MADSIPDDRLFCCAYLYDIEHSLVEERYRLSITLFNCVFTRMFPYCMYADQSHIVDFDLHFLLLSRLFKMEIQANMQEMIKMEKYNDWKLKFFTIWAGQAV